MNAYDALSNEQTAIEACYAAIESLDHSARQRVLQYTMQFCDEEHMRKIQEENVSKPMMVSPS
jgi:hypothetical protein